MSEFTDLYESFIKEVWVRDEQTFQIISIPFFFPRYDESIALRISKDENGFVLSDCHVLTDYWEVFDFPVDDYKERIDKICNAFGLYFEEKTLWMQTFVDDETRLFNAVGYFLQGLFMLANLEV